MNEEYLQDLLVRMAHHSTAIEGNSLTQGETKSIILENYVPRAVDLREVNEVINYKKLLPYLLENQKNNIDIQGIKDINRIVLNNIDDRGGTFKVIQNIIGGADFETTKPYMVPEEIKKWTDDLSWRLDNAKNNQEKVKIIMDQHIRFEKIHPFPDGNGRTGRALIIWSCLQHDLTPIVIEKEQRYEYIHALEEKSTKKLYRIAEKSRQIEEEKREELIKNLKKDYFLKEKEGENQEIDKNMLKTLYNELEDIHNTFPQNEELEAEKAEIQSSITVIKSKDEYERVKEDIRQYERDCMIRRRNLKKIREREAREQGFERYIKR